jgi:hypothetical protein
LRTFEAMSQDTRRQAMEQARRHAESFCSQAAVAAAVQRFLDGLDGVDACG